MVGELGRQTSDTVDPTLKPIDLSDDICIVQIAVGHGYSIILDDKGTVYTWGYNELGQLGRETTNKFDVTPRPILGLGRIKNIAAGGFHALAQGEDNTLYTWGDNEHSQLGRQTTGQFNVTPQRITGLSDKCIISQFALCNVRTWLLSSDGQRLYNYGDKLRQRSLPLSGGPEQIKSLLSPLKSIAACNNLLLMAGIDSSIHLLVPSPTGYTILKVKVEGSSSPIKQVAIGQSFILVLADDGVVYNMPLSNINSICDSLDKALKSNSLIVKPISGLPRIKSIATAFSSSGMVAYDGNVYVFGQDTHGELGQGYVNGDSISAFSPQPMQEEEWPPPAGQPSASADTVLRPCLVCRTLTSKGCETCRNAYYCSRACQKTDWLVHKEHCKRESQGRLKTCMRAGCSKTTSSGCKVCHQVYYCSQACQALDWPTHRKDCTAWLTPK